MLLLPERARGAKLAERIKQSHYPLSRGSIYIYARAHVDDISDVMICTVLVASRERSGLIKYICTTKLAQGLIPVILSC